MSLFQEVLLRQPERTQALQEVGCCCLGAPGVSSSPFAGFFGIQSYSWGVFARCGHRHLGSQLSCSLVAGAAERDWQRAQGWNAALQPGWMLEWKWRAENLSEEQHTVSVACSEGVEFFFFTELQGNGFSEVFMQLRCWDVKQLSCHQLRCVEHPYFWSK